MQTSFWQAIQSNWTLSRNQNKPKILDFAHHFWSICANENCTNAMIKRRNSTNLTSRNWFEIIAHIQPFWNYPMNCFTKAHWRLWHQMVRFYFIFTTPLTTVEMETYTCIFVFDFVFRCNWLVCELSAAAIQRISNHIQVGAVVLRWTIGN